jgi:hypothetical protein
MVVKDIGGGFVGVHLGKNTKEGCDWWVLGEMRIMAITNNSTEIWKKDQVRYAGSIERVLVYRTLSALL